MTEFNQYSLYFIACSQFAEDNEHLKKQETERIMKAFYDFHKPETYEERQKFVKDALNGKNYNQTLEFGDETMSFEFTDEFVKVTLHSPQPNRDNKYFQYALNNDNNI